MDHDNNSAMKASEALFALEKNSPTYCVSLARHHTRPSTLPEEAKIRTNSCNNHERDWVSFAVRAINLRASASKNFSANPHRRNLGIRFGKLSPTGTCAKHDRSLFVLPSITLTTITHENLHHYHHFSISTQHPVSCSLVSTN